MVDVFIILTCSWFAFSVFASMAFIQDDNSEYIRETKVKHLIIMILFPMVFFYALSDYRRNKGKGLKNMKLYKKVHNLLEKPIRKQGGKK